jgi:uncharacterized membrane-anchored protein YhcB (DUF1043 family)
MIERRHKSILTWVTEIVTMLVGIGVFGILIQIGEYKANFKNLCGKVADLKTSIDVQAAENGEAHLRIRADLETVKIDLDDTKQAVAAHTGRRVN